MTDREEIQAAAEFLAAHAVLLLGLAITGALAALGLVLLAVRILRRHQAQIRSAFVRLVDQARRYGFIDRAAAHSPRWLPTGYLVLHLGLGAVATTAVASFVVIAENVLGGGEIVVFDLAFARALRAASTPFWDRVFAGVSWLGMGMVLALAAVGIAIRLAATQGTLVAAAWLAAQAGGGLLNLALKEAFERTRPSSADPMLAASSWSFPSGHAMGTFILLGLACYVFLRDVRSWTAAAIAVTVSLTWCAVMAFSRLYLGVHFVSDVFAGVIAGAAWVAVCASALEVVRRREPPGALRSSSGGTSLSA